MVDCDSRGSVEPEPQCVLTTPIYIYKQSNQQFNILFPSMCVDETWMTIQRTNDHPVCNTLNATYGQNKLELAAKG